MLALAACSSLPDTYAPPVQREPLQLAERSALGPYISMGAPNAGAYIVRDIADTAAAGTWRWAFRRPELRFFVPANPVKFAMDFALAGQIFSGPVTLSVFVNGKLLDRFRYEKPGSYRLEKAVPPELIEAGAENRVTIESDKVWTSKDGPPLSFILVSAGFQE